jgi:hypothetical protein
MEKRRGILSDRTCAGHAEIHADDDVGVPVVGHRAESAIRCVVRVGLRSNAVSKATTISGERISAMITTGEAKRSEAPGAVFPAG